MGNMRKTDCMGTEALRKKKKERQPCMSLKGVAEMLSEGTIMGSS